MELSETYRCVRSLEAIENYAISDAPLVEGIERSEDPSGGRQYLRSAYNDNDFWDKVFRNPQKAWGKEFLLQGFVLSEWVARVPGLFWSRGARALRELASTAIEHVSKTWITYQPHGKSALVMGGIGTIKFPPDENGRRLATLSHGHNASSGIPALISPEVWQHRDLKEGDLVTIRARWQQMALGWAERFPSIKGIPRGYLILDESDRIEEIIERKCPTQFHPCTVMEYSKGDVKLFDFVYATADTRVPRYRKKLERFFSGYKEKRERYGRYLLSADIADPLFEADYDSPAALRRVAPGATAQLELIKTRVRDLSFGERTTEKMIEGLASTYDNVSLCRISDQIGIPHGQWFSGGPVVDSVAQLMHICTERNKVEELVDAIGRDRPRLFLPQGEDHGME